MTLGNCIQALSCENKKNRCAINQTPLHVPFRDSKLTRLL